MPIMETSASSFARKPPSLNAVDWLALVLVVVGGLNWGLVGLFNVDLVAMVFGPMSTVSRVVYVLVGLAALYVLYLSMRVGRRY